MVRTESSGQDVEENDHDHQDADGHVQLLAEPVEEVDNRDHAAVEGDDQGHDDDDDIPACSSCDDDVYDDDNDDGDDGDDHDHDSDVDHLACS